MKTGPQCFPCVESTRFCLIPVVATEERQNPSLLYLSSTSSGDVSISNNRSRAEEWTVVVPQQHSEAADCSHNDDIAYVQSVQHKRFLGQGGNQRILTVKQDEKEIKSLRFTLKETTTEGHYVLYCATTLTKLAYDSESKSVRQVEIGSPNDLPERASLWRLEFESGELCFLSHSVSDRRLSLGVWAKVFASEKWKGWEVWRIVEAGQGNVLITSWHHNNTDVLCSNDEGTLYTRQPRQIWGDAKAANDALWRIEGKCSNLGVVIRSVAHERLLSLVDGQCRTVNVGEDTSDFSDCCWALEPAHLNIFYVLNSALQLSLSCHQKTLKVSMSKNKKSWEQWEIQFVPGDEGFVTLRSKSNDGTNSDCQYLKWNSGSNMVSMSKDQCYWRVETQPNGTVWFITAEEEAEERFLHCDEQGSLYIRTMDPEDLEEELVQNFVSWALEPCMPSAINGNQMAAVGLTTAALALAAPMAVTGLVGALGFTSGGIAAGSTAAGMMSAEAVASCAGGVASGGLVATLQSIGAVGLGTVGTSLAVGSGAVVGGTIGNFVLRPAVGGRRASQISHESNVDQGPGFQRPFAAWKSWSKC